MRHVVAGMLALLALTSCASDPSHPKLFSTDWLDDHGKSIAVVRTRLRGSPPGPTADVAVAVAGTGDKILGLSLGNGATWSFQHPLDVRPNVTGNVVVGAGGGEAFALDAATGKKLWARPIGGDVLFGAGDDGKVTAITIGKDKKSTLFVIDRSGNVKLAIETDKELGDPAVASGIVFVPWQNQYVSAIDAQTGGELGRVVVRDKVSRALSIGGEIYFGEIAFLRFDDKIAQASAGKASRIGIPSRELPGTPRLLVPGSEKVPPSANARDRDRLFARPTGDATGIAIDSARFYATYFRLAFGFEAQKGQLAWVHTHTSDLIGGEAIAGGLVLCDEQGKLTVFDARTGQPSAEKTFGEPIKSCVVHADTWKAPAASGNAIPLSAQIEVAVTSKEATLATAQRLLLRELANSESEGATKTLIDIAVDPRSAPILVSEARAAIATRRNGTSFMLAALAKHYDYLADVLVSPPVGPIADALAAMKEKQAAPLLAAHLLDPANSDEDVKRAAAALAVLATEKEAASIRQFFLVNRATAETDEVALAVSSAGEALVRIDPKEGRTLAAAVARDPSTNDVVQKRLDAILAATYEEKKDDKPVAPPAPPKK